MVKGIPKLAIVTTHPIQYNAPLFRLLAKRNRVAIRVFYTWSQAQAAVYDPGFGTAREWDVPLLEGYEYCFVPNTAAQPGSHHFRGIRNPSLRSEIERWNPSAILVFGWSFHSHLQCLRYFKGRVPVFFRGDSTLLDEAGGFQVLLRRAFLKWVYRHVDVAFYTGRHNQQYYLKHGLMPGQLRRAFHAVDNDRFAEPICTEARLRWRLENGIGPEDFTILYAGKLEAKKNPSFLLRLAHQLQEPGIRFVVVGNGRLEGELKAAADGDPRFTFLPFQNQSAMPVVYQSCDCFILPSTGPGETWGLAANEAMAAGMPVLLSKKAGGADDLVDGNGIVFNPAVVGPVADCIRALKANPSYFGEACRLSTERIKWFSLGAVAEAIEHELLWAGAEADHQKACADVIKASF